MSNPFSLLATENSASSDDDSECVLAMGNSSHNVEIEDSIPKQNGGSFAQRLDPLTGICFSSTLQLDLGISDSDISTTTRVISVLTSNIQLFKLSKFKGLRAALHPLIIEQMKNYDPKESNNVGNCNEKRSNKRKRHRSGYGASTIDELHKLQKQKLDTLEEAYINQVFKGPQSLWMHMVVVMCDSLCTLLYVCFCTHDIRYIDTVAGSSFAATGRVEQRRIRPTCS